MQIGSQDSSTDGSDSSGSDSEDGGWDSEDGWDSDDGPLPPWVGGAMPMPHQLQVHLLHSSPCMFVPSVGTEGQMRK